MTDPGRISQSPAVDPATALEGPDPARLPLGEAEFRVIYDAEFHYVWHTLRRLGVAERDLEDLCHEVFVALYRGGYDRARPIRPWLFGIAFRIASDDRRRARNRFEIPTAPDAHEATDGAPRADEQVERAEERALVMTALGRLDLDKRAVFVMHEIDGHSMPEIAAALGAPLNTCYSRLRLGREQFANAVRRERMRRGERNP